VLRLAGRPQVTAAIHSQAPNPLGVERWLRSGGILLRELVVIAGFLKSDLAGPDCDHYRASAAGRPPYGVRRGNSASMLTQAIFVNILVLPRSWGPGIPILSALNASRSNPGRDDRGLRSIRDNRELSPDYIPE